MASTDLHDPGHGVLVLPEPDDSHRLELPAWVEQVRRPVTRQLTRPVADYLADARRDGEI